MAALGTRLAATRTAALGALLLAETLEQREAQVPLAARRTVVPVRARATAARRVTEAALAQRGAVVPVA